MSHFKLPLRYEFQQDGIIHQIDYRISQNSKLGLYEKIVSTYHFSVEQLSDFSKDSLNCLGCPFSYSNKFSPLSGKCYTHKGMQRMGLNSKMRSLQERDKIECFSEEKFEKFLGKIKTMPPKLVRFGAYGEPVLLPQLVRDEMWGIVDNKKVKGTGYTHAWRTHDDTRFMASVHTFGEQLDAMARGYRTYMVTNEPTEDDIICPASKEAGKKVSCADCGLCCGDLLKAKNIYIPQH